MEIYGVSTGKITKSLPHFITIKGPNVTPSPPHFMGLTRQNLTVKTVQLLARARPGVPGGTCRAFFNGEVPSGKPKGYGQSSLLKGKHQL